MDKKTIIIGVLIIILIILLALVFMAIFDEKRKFIGAWSYSAGGTITFNDDNTVVINNIGPLGLTELVGGVTYQIANNQVTFTAGSVSITLDYNFQDSSTLILTGSSGNSITLTKV